MYCISIKFVVTFKKSSFCLKIQWTRHAFFVRTPDTHPSAQVTQQRCTIGAAPRCPAEDLCAKARVSHSGQSPVRIQC